MSTHNIYHFQYKKNTLDYRKSAAVGFFKGLQNEFETAVVDESSVFEPLKFYCIITMISSLIWVCTLYLDQNVPTFSTFTVLFD